MDKNFEKPLSNSFLILMALMFAASGCNTNSEDFYLLAGTYTNTGSKGIYVYKFNVESGKAVLVSNTDSTTNPSYITVVGDFVYSVNETNGANPGRVSAFHFDKKDGKLTFLNSQFSGGDDPCYVAVSNDGKWLAVANYSGGNAAMFPINKDGSLSPFTQLIQHEGSGPNKDRQEKPHVHETVFSPDNKYLMMPDLGLDKLMIYSFNSSESKPLSPATPAYVESKPGSGPRHITFSPDNHFAYLIHELTGSVSVYKYDDGKLSLVEEVPTYPEGAIGNLDGAEIVVSPDGKFLYTSHRGDKNSLTIFSIDPSTGKLTKVGEQSSLGKGPRNFIIDPTGKFLLVANQKGDNVVIFSRNTETGLLEPTDSEIKIPIPVCLQIVPIK